MQLKKSISIPASTLQIHNPLKNKVEFKKSNHPTSTSRWATHNRRYHRYKLTGPLGYISQPDNTIYKSTKIEQQKRSAQFKGTSSV